MQKCKNSRGRVSGRQRRGWRRNENNFDFGYSHLMFCWFVGYVRYTDDMFAGLPFSCSVLRTAFLLFPPPPHPALPLLSTTFAYHFTSEHFSDHFLKYFCCRIVQSYRHKANICIANKRAAVEEIFNLRN